MVHNQIRAFACERKRNATADTGTAAGNKRLVSCELHAFDDSEISLRKWHRLKISFAGALRLANLPRLPALRHDASSESSTRAFMLVQSAQHIQERN
ncbi:MAG: hypothetical protein JJU27_09350 [Gammaproteobacteria bacterium]|nr:hypothetical protein [Gammaproteobacteria bacterium]